MTCFVLAGNTLLRPLVNAINRVPINQGSTEAIYEVRVTTGAATLDDARELLRQELERTNYPVQDIEVIEREGAATELQATLLGTSADPHELDQIVSRLDGSQLVESASWSIRTGE